MHVKILLKCAFGEDLSEETMDFEHEGKVEQKTLAHVLRTTFHECINRLTDPHIVIFPFLADIYITSREREILRNCQRLRNFLLQIVQKRRSVNLKQNDSHGDLLGILLEDENFNGDDRMIVDECLTFFFAGSQTSSAAAQNLILMLIKHPEIRDNILAELDTMLI
jgi:cytochrome P450